MITETDPADGAAGVEPMSVITVRFDEPITVREPADGLLLLDASGQPVPGTVEIDGDVLRFVPADDLALLGSYTAVVTAAVTDRAGNPLASEHRIQLSVRDGAWHAAGMIEDSDADILQNPDVAMDPRGNVAVVWAQADLPGSVWASRHDARTGLWEAVQLTEYTYTGQTPMPRIAMDHAGNAIAVWHQFDGTRFHVWASRHDGTAWGEPVRLDASDSADASDPRIAMNAGGAAIVVWRHTEDSTAQAWINRYAVGAGWGVAEPVQISGQPVSIEGWDFTTPVVAMDASRDAIVLVLDHMHHLQAVPHRAASGWREAEMLTEGPADDVALAMAPSGHTVALWAAQQGSSVHAWRHDPGGESQIDLLMEADMDSFSHVRAGDVAVNPAGDGIALWFEDWPGAREVWAGTSSAAAQAWTAPQDLLPPGAPRPRSAQVEMDPRGDAHAIWIVSDGNDYLALMTARRVAPGGFDATPITYEGIQHARLAVNAQGNAVIIRAVLSEAGAHVDLDAMFFR